MAIIKSYIIENAAACVGLEYKLKNELGIPMDLKPRFTVFKTFIDKKIVYVAWSGGEIRDGNIFCTPIGQAALDVLSALPVGSNETLIVQELKVGPTPIKAKVKKALKKAPRNSKIVFLGDMANTLDGEMDKALNMKGTVEI